MYSYLVFVCGYMLVFHPSRDVYIVRPYIDSAFIYHITGEIHRKNGAFERRTTTAKSQLIRLPVRVVCVFIFRAFITHNIEYYTLSK